MTHLPRCRRCGGSANRINCKSGHAIHCRDCTRRTRWCASPITALREWRFASPMPLPGDFNIPVIGRCT